MIAGDGVVTLRAPEEAVVSAFETLLSGRYELRERVSSDTASSYWRAHDVVLAAP